MTPHARPGDPIPFKIPTDDTVASIVARALHVPVAGVREMAAQGSVNRTFVANTPERQIVVRVNEAAEMPRFTKEKWAIDHAGAVGVPVPEVLSVGVADELAYMIESFVAGPGGRAIPKDQQLAAWRGIGMLLRRIHSVPVGGFGEEPRDMTEGGSANWDRYLEYNLNALSDSDPLVARGILDHRTQAKLRSSFQRLRVLPRTFGLSHGDMSLHNVISHEGRLHVIDWGEANAHFVPHFDFGIILEDSLDPASAEFAEVLEGYGMDLRDFHDLEPDVQALRLLIRTDKVRWALERKPERLAGRASDLKRHMAQLGW